MGVTTPQTAADAMLSFLIFHFFLVDAATTEIYTLSLHDALPIYGPRGRLCENTRSLEHHARDFSDRKSTRLNSSHANISYAVFCLKKNSTMGMTTFVLPILRTRATALSALQSERALNPLMVVMMP